MTIYPTAEEVIAAHARLIKRFGGSPGLRDAGALASALGRPQTGYYADVIQQAAALWESLSQNHPFVDGNKRVSIAVTAAFLRINGYRWTSGGSSSIAPAQALGQAQLHRRLRALVLPRRLVMR